MRIVFVLALFVAMFMVSVSTKAQPWVYSEETDPFTDKVYSIKVTAENSEGLLGVFCSDINGLGIFVGSILWDEEPQHTANIKWRINKGESTEFMTDYAYGRKYSVYSPTSINLARMLVDAKQLITSNGNDFTVIRFENLSQAKQINHILQACGH